MTAGYSYAWEFEVAPAARAEFERHYGPDGSWVQLFRRTDGYLGTLLLHDLARPQRYLTIDRWRDQASHQRFQSEHASEYAALDAQCAGLTLAERSLGEFAECPVPPA